MADAGGTRRARRTARARPRRTQVPAGGARGQQPAARRSEAHHRPNATTIDSLFGPLPTVETRGRAWLYINKQLKPVNLRLGISDGT